MVSLFFNGGEKKCQSLKYLNTHKIHDIEGKKFNFYFLYTKYLTLKKNRKLKCWITRFPWTNEESEISPDKRLYFYRATHVQEAIINSKKYFLESLS